MGYHLAGFDVYGVDKYPQPHYPFKFVQADVMDISPDFYQAFDAIHASPPCQLYTRKSQNWGRARVGRTEHPDLLEPTKEILVASGKPWALENVMGAPMIQDIMLCGTMFGLRIQKHRQFELSFRIPPAYILPPCTHGEEYNPWKGDGRSAEEHREAQGTPWLPQAGGASRKKGITGDIFNAIPPAYTKWIGGFLLAEVRRLQSVA